MSKKNNKRIKLWQEIISIITIICIAIFGYVKANPSDTNTINELSSTTSNTVIDLSSIPEYTSSPYVEINNNIPYFTESDYTTEAFEKYSDLVDGRSGVAFANICKETMPKSGEKRGDISSVKNLSGWVQKKYDSLIKDKYIKSTRNKHVLYRVTPIFEGSNRLASGVEMEALSVEDKGKSICFNVYCYNVQPGIVIDYATGNSHAK